MNTPLGEFAEYICTKLGYDKFLPASGGAEACETAVKAARRWGYYVKGVEDDKASVIMAINNFWGRSITGSGACSDPMRYKHFGPYTPGFPLAAYNSISAIREQLDADKNCVGIMLEPIQGEGGINVPYDGYFKDVKALCEEYDILMISDEVQTGFGRTGYMMAAEHDLGAVKPDITVIAKSASGGVTPVSGILASDEIMLQIKPGEHGSTFGGNPLGMAVAKRAVEVIYEEKMIENSKEMGAYMLQKAQGFKSPLIKEVRGRGLFIGIELHDIYVDANDLAKIILKHGVISKATHKHCLRLTPALVINKKEVDDVMEIVEKSL